MPSIARRQFGFTMIEAIMVLTITGIIGAVVAVFIKAPVDAYFDTARRAALADVADIAVRRMSRDIRLALPGSVRNALSGADLDQCIEFMPTKIGGRYRAALTSGGAGDILDFTDVDSGFDMLWLNSALPTAEQIAAGDVVVVYNDGSLSGNAYTGTNAVQVASVSLDAAAKTTGISLVAVGAAAPFGRKQFPAESPSYRFQVVPSSEHVVSYRCNGGTLWRNARTLTGSWSQPNSCADMASGATSARLADDVSTCSIKYEPPGSGTGAGRYGIVSISLQITQSGESVRLYHQVHVDNTP